LGTQLDGRYRLDRLVGEGATAWVFAAQDLRLERDIAVKVLKSRLADEQAAQRKRFVAEGRTLARLVHPHVVLVHDAGETKDGVGYLVMELSEAGSLESELYRRGSLSAEECLQLLLPLLGALACAHDRGIVHRDIKPANIALVHERHGMKAKLLDFGIAKRRDAEGSTDHALGTPSYMAPEQARGEPLTPAADVWALGVLFFRCLSGRMPFDADCSLETLRKLVHERAPRFAQACPKLGPHFAVALDRALEPDVKERYPDVRSFARALASASAQDGIQVPQRPDPVGLPDFEHWLASADISSTRPLAGNERAQIALDAATLARTFPRRWRARWIAAFAITGSALVVGWLSTAPIARGVAAPRRAAPIADAPKVGVTVASPQARAAALPAPATTKLHVESALAPAEIISSPPLPEESPRAANKRAVVAKRAPASALPAEPPSAATESSSAPRSVPPAPAPANARPALMKAYEW
jgi:serine/threonine-protein kinase